MGTTAKGRLKHEDFKKKLLKDPEVRKEYIGLKHGFRSGFEGKIEEQILSIDGVVSYEPFAIPYEQKQSSCVCRACGEHQSIYKKRQYTPDFQLKNGILIETKGRFLGADRTKHLAIKDNYPDMDIRFVFTNSRQWLTSKKLTTYGDWCTKNGFKYADKQIPEAWFYE